MLVSLARTYLRPYAGAVGLLLVLQLLATLASLYLPSLNADIVDNGVTTGDTAYIMRVGGWMLVVSLVQVACAIGAVFLGARAATALGRDVRRDLFDSVQGFSARELGQFGAPSLITRTTNDVQQVMMVVLMTFTIMVMAPIMLVGGVIMALQEDVELSALLLVVVPVLGIAMGLLVIAMNFIHSAWVAAPFLILLGALGGYLVVPMNALLQHRGHNLMGAGRSIAVQNFNEQACILGLGAFYSLSAGMGLSAFGAITAFGVVVAGVMWLIQRWHARNCIVHKDEVDHLLELARHDVHG